MHTILGAGGPVSNALAHELLKNNLPVRLVSRRKIENFKNATWTGADLKNYQQVLQAVQGSTVIYMCAGLQYNKKVWAAEWPVIMQNLIDATKATGARLIFFDNVYMYGHVRGQMTEETPYNPNSAKGEVRAKIAEKLMNEAQTGNLRATIARAPDFYGTDSLNSFYDGMVLAKYAQKAKAMWLGNPEAKHAFIYIPDAGKAVYLLGQHPETDNQIWHIPTAPALTGYEFIKLAADAFNTKPNFTKVNKLMLQTIGLFNKLIAETAELYYQYQYDYVFSSQKFENKFGIKPTAYTTGITQYMPLLRTLIK
ncbi:NAD-dependent epimerase/dehydratase family protein [Adhaeribacter swui]|uniref:NAD-dependent epimerase/dehydratase family protein n=1 Tax=Adhaeribacter swui TaxID=2086471 RepID=A0A7G7G6A5_9BACT|nr:NAD-dependent epimerase/dehydratase family protein [Adhaeribacter swui]QNF32689.1 NAD-dependent epimerase/dehydratase family protein [Adhaeribacter swui]